MDKICEFCAALRPVVFCKADSAFLCLSCDARVHSANALSNRHFRCLLCERCREQPAGVRCLDHRMLLCQACDESLHGKSAKHRRRMVSTFTGSPSAKQFALLWGFDVRQLALEDQLAGLSTSSIDSAGSVVSAEFSVGSSHPEQDKTPGKDQQQSCLIMQQIQDLNRLQLSEGNSQSSAIRERGQSHSSSSCMYKTLGKIDECLFEDGTRDSSAPTDDFHGLKGHHFLSPLSQSEYLSPYASTAAISLAGEPFWQSRTALESNQFWPQNLEEQRVSEEVACFDNFKMPEVDMNFSNFEELLREDQDLSRALLEDDSTAFFCSEKDPSADKSEHSDAHSAHVKGISVSSSIHMEETNHGDQKRANSSLREHQALESPTMIRPSYSYSFSHLSAESSGSDCHDNGHSGDLARAELHSAELEGLNITGHASTLVGRFKDRKKSRLNGKQTQLAPRKIRADPSKRLKGRILELEDEGCLSVKSSRSF